MHFCRAKAKTDECIELEIVTLVFQHALLLCSWRRPQGGAKSIVGVWSKVWPASFLRPS